MIWEQKLKHIMNTSVLTFVTDTKIEQAVHSLVKHQYSGAPVVDGHGKVIGMLTQKDCLQAIINSQYHETIAGFVHDYMKYPVETLEPGMGLFEVAQRFLNSNYRRFPVTEGDRLLGIVTRVDLLRAIDNSSG